MTKRAMGRNEFRKWLETMSVKASYSDQRELLRVVLKHYDDSLAQEKPTEPSGLVEALDECARVLYAIMPIVSTKDNPNVPAAVENAYKQARKALSRYRPAPSSADHFVEVNKLVKRLRAWHGRIPYKMRDDRWTEFYAILSEFSKGADGKEGRI